MEKEMELFFYTAMAHAFSGEDPALAIDEQIKRGQNDIIRKQLLPKKLNDHSLPGEARWNGVKDSMGYEERSALIEQNNISYTRMIYEKMGVSIHGEVDDLFWEVSLPEGWRLETTGHSMWNDLFDAKGRKRANFFYKSSCYDRDAFINFNTRYHATVDHVAGAETDYETWKMSDYQGIVTDGDAVIFQTERIAATGDLKKDDKIKEQLWSVVNAYMKEHYPNYTDIHAYWD